MNKFLSAIASHVGAKQLTYFAAFAGLVVVSTLAHRYQAAPWNSSLDSEAVPLPSTGAATVFLEDSDPPRLDLAGSANGTNPPVVDSSIPTGDRNMQGNDPVLSRIRAVRSESARKMETSSADDFGLVARGDQAAPPLVGSGSGRWGGSSPPIAPSGASGLSSAGGPAPMSGGHAKGNPARSAGESARDTAKAPSSEGALTNATEPPAVDTVPDPSPVMPDPIPLASSPSIGSQNSKQPENDDVVPNSAPSSSTDPQPVADYGTPGFGETGATPADDLATLKPDHETASLLANPGLDDLTDLKKEELVAADHVPDLGHSLLLLTGGLLGVGGLRRWHLRATRPPR